MIETIAKDELVKDICKVYWSKKNKQVVAKISLIYKSRSRQVGAFETSKVVSIKDLKSSQPNLFIDFMCSLIHERVRAAKNRPKSCYSSE